MTQPDPVRRETPRPWFHVGRPWSDGPGLIYSGSEDPHAGNMVADTESSLNPKADAMLIVEAVNNYDRLRAIEAAARAWADHNPSANERSETLRALRVALERPSA